MLNNVTATRNTVTSIATVTSTPNVANQAVSTMPPTARILATSAAVMESVDTCTIHTSNCQKIQTSVICWITTRQCENHS